MNAAVDTYLSDTTASIDLALILEHTSDAVCILDADLRYVHVNRSAEMLLRRNRGTLLGRHHFDEFSSLRGTPAESQLHAAITGRRATSYEQFIPQLYAWHQVLAVPSGERVVLFLRDITDRVRALREEAVREGLRSILEHIPAAVTLTRGSDHRVDLQNERSRQLVGGTSVEGRTVALALPEAVEQGFVALLDNVFATGQTFVGKEMPLTWKTGPDAEPQQRFFDLTYQPVFETDGKVSGILHLAYDVTVRMREKEQLAEMAAERYAILRQLDEGVILTAPDGKILFVNEAACQLHGVAILDVNVNQYSAAYQLLTEEGMPYPSDELPLARAVLHNEHVCQARWRIARPDGSVILVEGSARPIVDEKGRKFACVLTLHAI